MIRTSSWHRNDIDAKFQLKYQKRFLHGFANGMRPSRSSPFNVLWQTIEQNIKRGVQSFHLRRPI
jgi:hypothetical protein